MSNLYYLFIKIIFLMFLTLNCFSKNFEKINLQIKSSDLLKLLIENENIKEKFDKYVTHDFKNYNAKINFNSENYSKVKIRLKGDSLDHYNSNFPSIRINVKDDNHRLESFDLSDPRFRNFHWDIFVRSKLNKKIILVPSMELVNLVINDSFHYGKIFEEILPNNKMEFFKKRDGMIIKFDDKKFTEFVENYDEILSKEELNSLLHWYTLDLELVELNGNTSQNDISINLFNGFLNKDISPLEIFDPIEIGYYLANAEFWCASHTVELHNVRFFWDITRLKMTPVWWDSRPGWCHNSIFDNQFALLLLSEDKILKEFIKFYSLYESSLNILKKELTKFESAYEISSFPKLPIDFIVENYLRKLEKYKKITNKDVLSKLNSLHLKTSQNLYHYNNFLRDFSYETKFYPKNNFSNIYRYQKKIELIDPNAMSLIECTMKKICKKLSNKKLSTIINKIDYFGLNQVNIENSYFIENINVEIDNSIIVGDNEQLIILENTKLKFRSDTGIYVFGDIVIIGDENNKISLTSNYPKSFWNGLHIYSSFNKKTFIKNLELSNIKRQNYIDVCISVVNSKIFIENLNLNNCFAEDGINLIYSEGKIQKIKIENSFSDGIDSDFSDLEINNLNFSNIGGDGIDFSGSKVFLYNSYFKNIGDKAISIGEASEISLDKIFIDNAKFGIVVKDFSNAKASNINLNDVKLYDFATFSKKKYLGGGKLILVDKFNEDYNSLCQIGSELIFSDNNLNCINFDTDKLY